jgi:hypothetical protein
MKAYIPDFPSHAGRWIYKGYRNAWKQEGFDVNFYEDYRSLTGESGVISSIPTTRDELSEQYIVMTVDSLVNQETLEALDKSYKSFVYVQPNIFPMPWGRHPNFQCAASDKIINLLNKMNNVHLWTFGDNTDNHTKWKKVNTIPLAFDSVSYVPITNKSYSKYDVCFVGGWADNGFNEKKPIMIKYFSEFMKSELNCGVFINKNISTEQESLLLYNSKITLNIHDAYQRVLGYDTNERTFKSLGLNGAMVSDKITQLERLFPKAMTSTNPSDMVSGVKKLLSLSEVELQNIKNENKQNILDNHCYTNRVKTLLEL